MSDLKPIVKPVWKDWINDELTQRQIDDLDHWFSCNISGHNGNQEELSDFDVLDKALAECPMTWVPALFITIITRCRKEPIFKGWMGMQSFISKAYKKAGEK